MAQGGVGLARFQNLNYLFKDLESQRGGGCTSPKQQESGSREELGSRKPSAQSPGRASHLRHPGRAGHREGTPPSPPLPGPRERLPADFSRYDRYGQFWARGNSCLLLPPTRALILIGINQACGMELGGRDQVRAQIPGPTTYPPSTEPLQCGAGRRRGWASGRVHGEVRAGEDTVLQVGHGEFGVVSRWCGQQLVWVNTFGSLGLFPLETGTSHLAQWL